MVVCFHSSGHFLGYLDHTKVSVSLSLDHGKVIRSVQAHSNKQVPGFFRMFVKY